MTQPATQPATRPADQLAGGPDRFGAPGQHGQHGQRETARASAGPRPGRLLGLHTGQIVTAQVALALLVAGFANGVVWLIAVSPIAVVLVLLAFGRVRRRWAYQWIGHGMRYLGRRRSLPAGADALALLTLLRPAASVSAIDVDGASVGMVTDAFGVTAVLEIGDTTGLLAEAPAAMPALTALLPPAAPDQPGVRLQLLVTGVPAPAARTGNGAAATSYRQLTEGRILAQQRVLIAVHVRRAGGFADADTERTLASAVRRVRRRFNRDSMPCRPLAADSVLAVLAELAHHDPARPYRENWAGVELGGLRQVSFRLRRWPDPGGELAGSLLSRLLTLPAGGTTVSLATERITDRIAATGAGSGTVGGPAVLPPPGVPGSADDALRAELVIRLAAPSTTALAGAVTGLRRLLGAAGAKLQRLDGAQIEGLAATLPLGGASGGPDAALAGLVAGRDGLGIAGSPAVRLDAAALAAIEPPVGGAGLMLGVNRHGEPVTVRLFRPEPTRAALVGGLRCAQALVLRALALGAQVIVQSGRPYAWEPFLRGLSGSADSISLVAPGRIIEPPPATPVQPQLLVVDVGPVGATGVPVVESAWRATLLVRDELSPADIDIFARADIAMLQPLTPQEAALAAAALGLGDSANWLTRIRADMLGVVVGRRTLRWTLLSSTPIEQQLIGPPTR